jgi:hypothetical protein
MLAAGDSPPAIPADPAPSVELLLYLGEFEDAGGEFVDPMSIDEPTPITPPDSSTHTPAVEDESRDGPDAQSA